MDPHYHRSGLPLPQTQSTTRPSTFRSSVAKRVSQVLCFSCFPGRCGLFGLLARYRISRRPLAARVGWTSYNSDLASVANVANAANTTRTHPFDAFDPSASTVRTFLIRLTDALFRQSLCPHPPH